MVILLPELKVLWSAPFPLLASCGTMGYEKFPRVESSSTPGGALPSVPALRPSAMQLS